MRIAVCLKWVDTRPEVDALSGAVTDDERWFAASPADQAALETALRIADTVEAEVFDAEVIDAEVLVVCAGPVGAEQMLREGVAVGATRAVRVDIDPELDTVVVAAAIAEVLDDVDIVCCGSWSLDRGTGSFPAFLAHCLGAAQALGCTTVTATARGLAAERRLDGGRRERLRLGGRAVVSVEAGLEIRRASLPAVLGATEAVVEVVRSLDPAAPASRLEWSGPYRPRSRELAPPAGEDVRDRLLSLTGALGDGSPSRALRLDPGEAADHLLAALGAHGVGPEADGPE